MVERKPKRGHVTRYGEGSFKWVPSRGLWVGRYDTGRITPAGTRIVITASGRDEDAAWQAFVAKKKDYMLHGPRVPEARASETVRTWAEKWLRHRDGEVRATTYAQDKTNVVRWIVPAIGTIRLEALTAAHMRAVGDGALKAGRSGSTANSAQRTLTKMLNAAKSDGHRVPDRIFAATKASRGKSARTRMSKDEVRAVFQHAYATQSDAIRYVIAVLYGARQGEVLGLTWDRVRIDPTPEPDAVVVGEIDLTWQVQQLPYRDRAAGTYRTKRGDEVEQLVDSWHLTRPKTASGARALPIITPVAKELAAWREKCPTGKANPHNLVFPRIDGAPRYRGHPRNDKADLATWKELQRAAGVYKRAPDPAVEGDEGEFYVLHEARHSMISMLADAGTPRHIIEMLVGQTELVEGYVHGELEAAGRAVSDALADLLPALDPPTSASPA
ncbi:phage integrase family protein [Salana multivorans]|uniref:Phage integrase family protein n=1 Tax=Salana multivorans TaxID=120377 RepID=A0A3N2D2L7_9MICO|nr:tyrosine-type recombinase/integrase [Salana multivorans]ROR94015.1 phage integrase family protein [Salana multivorans]ROR97848.1 phage integrase family protein [Salana multivorans]